MGGRISLSIGIVAMSIAMAAGILVGAFAGFYGGILGALLMRFVDAVLCFPTIFLLLTLAALIEPGLMTTTLLIAATAWMQSLTSKFRGVLIARYSAAPLSRTPFTRSDRSYTNGWMRNGPHMVTCSRSW